MPLKKIGILEHRNPAGIGLHRWHVADNPIYVMLCKHLEPQLSKNIGKSHAIVFMQRIRIFS